MASRADELDEAVVALIDDDFSRLPSDRQERVSGRWVATLHQGEPIELATAAAELLEHWCCTAEQHAIDAKLVDERISLADGGCKL